MMNHQREYDRIISALNQSAIPGVTKNMLKERRNELGKLGVKAVKTNPVF